LSGIDPKVESNRFGSFRPRQTKHRPEYVSPDNHVKDDATSATFNVVNTQNYVQRCTVFLTGTKGVWWMPWLQEAMKDVEWLR
jgi:hypothetical protein